MTVSRSQVETEPRHRERKCPAQGHSGSKEVSEPELKSVRSFWEKVISGQQSAQELARPGSPVRPPWSHRGLERLYVQRPRRTAGQRAWAEQGEEQGRQPGRPFKTSESQSPGVWDFREFLKVWPPRCTDGTNRGSPAA